MPRLKFDQTGERYYETGTKNGVLYPMGTGANAGKYPTGYAWNGLTGVSENPSGAEANPIYADDMKYLNLISAEEYGLTINAYQSPVQFDECDGTSSLVEGLSIGQQERKMFGFAWRTQIGNDVDGQDHGYKIHMAWGCQAAPSSRDYATINDSPEAMELSWEVTTTPVDVTGKKPTASATADSTVFGAENMKKLEQILYGVDADDYDATAAYSVGDYCTHTDGTTEKTYECNTAIAEGGETWTADHWTEIDAGPRLPLPNELITIFGA